LVEGENDEFGGFIFSSVDILNDHTGKRENPMGGWERGEGKKNGGIM